MSKRRWPSLSIALLECDGCGFIKYPPKWQKGIYNACLGPQLRGAFSESYSSWVVREEKGRRNKKGRKIKAEFSCLYSQLLYLVAELLEHVTIENKGFFFHFAVVITELLPYLKYLPIPTESVLPYFDIHAILKFGVCLCAVLASPKAFIVRQKADQVHYHRCVFGVFIV